MEIQQWLNAIKPSWGVQFGPAFDDMGVDNTSDLPDMSADTRKQLNESLKACGAKPAQLDKIWRAVDSLSTLPSPAPPEWAPESVPGGLAPDITQLVGPGHSLTDSSLHKLGLDKIDHNLDAVLVFIEAKGCGDMEGDENPSAADNDQRACDQLQTISVGVKNSHVISEGLVFNDRHVSVGTQNPVFIMRAADCCPIAYRHLRSGQTWTGPSLAYGV